MIVIEIMDQVSQSEMTLNKEGNYIWVQTKYTNPKEYVGMKEPYNYNNKSSSLGNHNWSWTPFRISGMTLSMMFASKVASTNPEIICI